MRLKPHTEVVDRAAVCIAVGPKRRSVSVQLAELRALNLQDLRPVRGFAAYPGQRRHPGLYWCDTTGHHLGYESRLEMANLLLLDFDPRVQWIVSQPLRLHFETAAKKRSHVPDFLVRTDADLRIIDVSLPHRRADPEIRLRHEITGRAVAAGGIGYEIRGVPDRTRLAKLRLLSAHRVAPWGFDEYRSDVLAQLGSPCPLGEVENAIGPATMLRPVMLHLLWTHVLECEMDTPLSEATVVHAARQTPCR